MSMKNSNDTIGNRTRDLPASSVVPQPTAPARAPVGGYGSIKFLKVTVIHCFVILLITPFLDLAGTEQHVFLPFVFIARATTSSCFISTP